MTGATDGLGRGLSAELAHLGATVLLHGRSEQRLAETMERIVRQTPTATVRTYRADFASLREVADMATAIRTSEARLDVNVSNAGVGFPPQRLESADGNELVLQVTTSPATWSPSPDWIVDNAAVCDRAEEALRCMSTSTQVECDARCDDS